MSATVQRLRRRAAGRGQSGMTLLETLLVMMLSALMVMPVLGWASLAMREQRAVAQRNLSGASLGVLRTVFTRDVVNSDRAWVDGEHLEDCVVTTKGARPLLVLVSGNRHTVYATVPDRGDGDSKLVRVQCPSAGTKATVEHELVGDVVDAGTDASCTTVSRLAELEAERSPKLKKDAAFEARLADHDCSRVTLRITTGQLDQVALTATRRSSPSGVDANAPIAVIAADPTTGLRPLEVSFDGSASRDPLGEELTYRWDFGDGTSGQGASIGHSYTTTGTFTATLTVTAAKSARIGSTTVLITVGNNAPVAVISSPSTGTSVYRGQKVSFSSKGSGDPVDAAYGGKIASYKWDFGDGTTSTDANPTTSYSTLSASGYKVSLTVTDDGGLTSTGSIVVKVVNRVPTVAVTATPSSGASPLSVSFTASVVDEPDMASPPTLKYAWSFGNGTTSSAAAPTAVTYSSAGTFTATLTVTDDEGATGSGSQTITVTAATGPAAPVNLRKTNNGVEQGLRFIEMAWDRRDGATRYEVRLTCVDCSEVATGQESGTTLRIRGLSKGAKEYDAQVRAQGSSGTWGAWSAAVRVKS